MSCWCEKGRYWACLLRMHQRYSGVLQCGCACVDSPFAHVRDRGGYQEVFLNRVSLL